MEFKFQGLGDSFEQDIHLKDSFNENLGKENIPMIDNDEQPSNNLHGGEKPDTIDLTGDNLDETRTQKEDVDEVRYFGRHSLPFTKYRGKLPESTAYELVNS